nr:MAG: hypothetical protein [Lestijarvi obscuruvirus]
MSLEAQREVYRQRRTKAAAMIKSNVVPLVYFMGGSVTKKTSSNGGTIAKAVLNAEGLTPWAALALNPTTSAVEKAGMLTAPWCGEDMTISDILKKNRDRVVEIIKSPGKKVTTKTARRAVESFSEEQVNASGLVLGDDDDAEIKYLDLDKAGLLTVQQICVWLSVMSYEEQHISDAADSVFMLLAGVAKGGNVTLDWINSRKKNLKDNTGFATITEITPTDISGYASQFLPSQMDENQLCEILRAYYISFKDIKFEQGLWIIQQAPGMNCAPLQAFATLILESRISYIVITQAFPFMKNEVAEAARAMATVIKFPFCNIRKPAVPLRNYGSLAYLCVSLVYGEKYNKSSLERNCRNKADIDAMVTVLKNTANATGQDRLNRILVSSFSSLNLGIRNGQVVSFPSVPPVGAVRDREPLPDLRTCDLNAVPGLVAVTLSDLLSKNTFVADKDLITLCREFVRSTSQQELNTNTLKEFCTRDDNPNLSQENLNNLGVGVIASPWDIKEAMADMVMKPGNSLKLIDTAGPA